MKFNTHTIRMALAAGIVSLCGATAVHATPTLTISSGGTTITVVDGGANDADLLVPGEVGFVGSVGVYNLNLDVGATKPFSGTATIPYFTLNATANSSAAGVLTIMFSDTDFGPSNGIFRSTLTGYAGGTVTSNAYDSTSNALFAESTLLTSLSGSGPLNSTSANGVGTPTGSYSLTEVLTITHTGMGTTSAGTTTTVPDGGSTLTLIGLSLVAIVGVHRLINGQSLLSL